jgi:glycosyltransferase involved in cell wall biosynthesis
MNILLISPLPPPKGGIATWTEVFLNSIITKHHNVKLVNTAVKGKRASNLSKISIIGEIGRFFSILAQLKASINTNKFDLAHLNISCSRLGLVRDMLFAAFITRDIRKLVIHCHCDTSYQVKGSVARYFFKKICNYSSAILCLNKASAKHVKAVTGKDSIVVPNFIDLNQIKTRPRNQGNKGIKSIIYVGHIIKTKGCDSIIEAAKRMPHITYKLVGYICNDYKNMNYPSNVIFLGEVSRENVFEEMQNSDILLFPSHTEGFPNVILEAMACGLPIIATPVGAIPDIIEDKGGVLVDIGDVDGIVKAVQMLENLDVRNRMSDWNRKKIKSSYTIDKVINTITNLYEEEGLRIR